MFQPIYKEIMKSRKVEFIEGFPDFEPSGEPTLLILDDLMLEGDKRLAIYFTRMRHANLSTIFVTQNFYHNSSHMRTVTRNAHYLVLFSNPRDVGMIGTIGHQMFPDKPKFIIDAFRKACTKPYGYLFLDCKPNAQYRVKEGIFPDENTFVYLPL